MIVTARTGTSGWTRPDLKANAVRVLAVCREAASLLPAGAGGPVTVTARVTERLRGANYDVRRACAVAATDITRELLMEAISDTEERIARARSPRSPSRPSNRSLSDALFERLRRLQARLDSTVDSDLRLRLVEVWDTTRADDPEAVLRAAADEGHDTGGLLDALARAESTRHLNLVWSRAHRMCRKMCPDRDASELIGWGWIGLLAALKAYDPSRGAFSTYAAARIDGAIRDGLRADSPVPKRAMTLRRSRWEAESTLAQALCRMPTLDEIAERLGVDVERLRTLDRLGTPASLDTPAAPEPAAGDDPADTVGATTGLDELVALADSLSPDHGQLARMLAAGLTPPEISGAGEWTRRQIRRMCAELAAAVRSG